MTYAMIRPRSAPTFWPSPSTVHRPHRWWRLRERLRGGSRGAVCVRVTTTHDGDRYFHFTCRVCPWQWWQRVGPHERWQ